MKNMRGGLTLDSPLSASCLFWPSAIHFAGSSASVKPGSTSLEGAPVRRRDLGPTSRSSQRAQAFAEDRLVSTFRWRRDIKVSTVRLCLRQGSEGRYRLHPGIPHRKYKASKRIRRQYLLPGETRGMECGRLEEASMGKDDGKFR